jgi:signal recognition particle GTPase
MLDSMTGPELDGKVVIKDNRIVRIASGSGTSIREVNELLEEHKKYYSLVQKQFMFYCLEKHIYTFDSLMY